MVSEGRAWWQLSMPWTGIATGVLSGDERLAHPLFKCILAEKLQSWRASLCVVWNTESMGRGDAWAQLSHPQPEHGLSVLQIGGKGMWQLVDQLFDQRILCFHFALDPANCLADLDSEVFISSPALFSVLQMVYLPAC